MSEIIVITPEQLEKLIERTFYKVLRDLEFTSAKDSSDDVMDIKQAADYLHIPYRSIYNFTYQRLIPYYKKGKRLYFRKEDLKEWVRSGKKEMLSEIKFTRRKS